MLAPVMFPEFWFASEPSSCTYLPEEVWRKDYRYYFELSAEQFAGLLNRGWRRFGNRCFRPACPACARCRSLRVKVAEFQPTKSQRRILARNQDIRLEVRPASVSAARLRLYRRYHDHMATKKGWPPQPITAREYLDEHVGQPLGFGYDFLYYLGRALIAVGLVDITPQASSSAYFYYEPSLSTRSLGVFSLLKELEYAREHQIPHHHLGYWIPESPAMNYKGAYHPRELLVGYPYDDEEPLWVPEEKWRATLHR